MAFWEKGCKNRIFFIKKNRIFALDYDSAIFIVKY